MARSSCIQRTEELDAAIDLLRNPDHFSGDNEDIRTITIENDIMKDKALMEMAVSMGEKGADYIAISLEQIGPASAIIVGRLIGNRDRTGKALRKWLETKDEPNSPTTHITRRSLL